MENFKKLETGSNLSPRMNLKNQIENLRRQIKYLEKLLAEKNKPETSQSKKKEKLSMADQRDLEFWVKPEVIESLKRQLETLQERFSSHPTTPPDKKPKAR